MAARYYDDILVAKIKRWVPEEANIRVLKPDESKRLFEVTANDGNDKAFTLPLIALSRNNDIELLATAKQSRSFDGLHLLNNSEETLQFNVIPIKLQYQLDIYTKTFEEGDEYVRNFVFKLINNPLLKIEIPYNNTYIEHTANIRVLSTISDTSSISERIFSGQFTRWSIQLIIQDAFLFSLPYKRNWKFDLGRIDLEVSEKITLEGELEEITFEEPVYIWSEDYSTCTAKVVIDRTNNVLWEETVESVFVDDAVDEVIAGAKRWDIMRHSSRTLVLKSKKLR